VSRAHELVADHVSVGEIVVEVRAPPGHAADTAVPAAPKHELIAAALDRDDVTRGQ
jgi:hypothetical protein